MQDLKEDIDRLNSFLRGERAAVETYEKCIEKLETPTLTAPLTAVRESHQKRVLALTAHIGSIGGGATNSSGTWGSFARLVTNGAGLFGDGAALVALEKGEVLGHSDYHSVADLTRETRAFVSAHLVSEQLATRDALRQLRREWEAQP